MRSGWLASVVAGAVSLAAGGCAEQPLRTAERAKLVAAVQSLPIADNSAVLIAAGDIARCDKLAVAEATADLVDVVIAAAPRARVLTTGDHVYDDGTAREFEQCYEPTWGRFNARTMPSPGNHDYRSVKAAPYFEYFEFYDRNPSARAAGYYSFDVDDWHVISLNSNLDMEPGSPQLEWLEADLRGNNKRCILAYWHHPLFTSGFHGLQLRDRGRDTVAFWELLSAFGGDLVVNGHAHMYERFAPQKISQQARGSEIRQIVVGTGGAKRDGVLFRRARSEYLNNDAYGVLVLMLDARGYQWAFLGTDGEVHDRSTRREAC